MSAEDLMVLFDNAPKFELRYEEEAKDHLVKVNEWLRNTGMDTDWEAIVAKPNQLFLDYDTSVAKYWPKAKPGEVLVHGYDASNGQLETVLKTMEEAYNIAGYAIGLRWTVSKSGNYHCVVTLPDFVAMKPLEAAAWQAAAGSDPKREALHTKSCVLGSQNPNILIEKKKVQNLLGE